MLSPFSQHVYPLAEEILHGYNGGANCYCEPRIEERGVDKNGNPIRIFIHQLLSEKLVQKKGRKKRVQENH